MTRKEIEQLNVVEPNCFETDREKQWYEVGLKRGLETADNSPQWISVDDDLPCNHEDMIFKINPVEKITDCVLVRFSYGGVSIECMHCIGYKQEWRWLKRHITHWMIIPELLKE